MRLVLAAFFCLNTFGATLLDTAPLRFEPNPGLGPKSPAKWSARGAGYAFLFADDATLIKTSAGMVKLTFPGADRAAEFAAERPLKTRIDYFIGQDYANVRAYQRLRRTQIYPGIDLVYYGVGHQIEYDFEIAPGADVSRIRMRFDGAKKIALNDRGEIVLECAAGAITQHRPVVYQRNKTGQIAAIPSSYIADGANTFRLKLGVYDSAQPLTVDPTITYEAYVSSESTGETVDNVVSVVHDPTGKIYLYGSTYSTSFPVTPQAFLSAIAGPENLWIAVIDPSAGADALLYCSYVGGQSNDVATQMTVDPNGVMFLTGNTDSTTFPISTGAYLNTYTSNTHPFITMIDPSQPGSGALVYSTYFGGSGNDSGQAIAVVGNKIYVAGWTNSTDFPLAGNSYQASLTGGNDAWVAIFDPTQSGTNSLLSSTYLGGSNDEIANSIAIDPTGLVYVGGMTSSTDYPTTPTAYQPGLNGNANCFLAVLDMNAGNLDYSTYLGGSVIDDVKRIELNGSPGNVAMAGYTVSPDFPVTSNAYQNTMPGPGNAFVALVNVNSSAGQGLLYSTYFGGSGGEVAYDMRQDAAGRFYFAGYTLSPNLPVTANAMYSASIGGSIDGFVAVLDPSQAPSSQLVYSTYITGPGFQELNSLDLDASGTIYITGTTTANVFPNGTPPNADVLATTVFVLTFTLP